MFAQQNPSVTATSRAPFSNLTNSTSSSSSQNALTTNPSNGLLSLKGGMRGPSSLLLNKAASSTGSSLKQPLQTVSNPKQQSTSHFPPSASSASSASASALTAPSAVSSSSVLPSLPSAHAPERDAGVRSGGSRFVPSSSSSSAAPAPSAPSSRGSTIPAVIVDERTGRQFVKGAFLGKGGFAECYELMDRKNGIVYAGKIVNKLSLSRKAKQKLKSEITIHSSVDHENIVRFEHSFEDAVNVYILLELCSNQSMMELVKIRQKLTEPEVRYFMHQIVNATEYLHTNAIIHRDLKLGNFFLSADVRIKVGDFGLATRVEFDGERKKTLCGTPNYIAPEILEGEHTHSYEVDIWAIGVVLYILLFGRPPFETDSAKATYERIQNISYHMPADPSVSPAARSLIASILTKDPSSRPSLDTIRRHPFMTNPQTPDSLPTACLTYAPKWTWEAAAPPKHQAAPTAEPIAKDKPFHASLSGAALPSIQRVPLSKNGANIAPVAMPNLPNLPMSSASLSSSAATHLAARVKAATAPAPAPAPVASLPSTATVSSSMQSGRPTASAASSSKPQRVAVSSPQTEISSLQQSMTKLSLAATQPSTSTALQEAPKAPVASVPRESQLSQESQQAQQPAQKAQRVAIIEHFSMLITSALNQQYLSEEAAPAEIDLSLSPRVWVAKWVDLSQKLGLGYQLSDGTIGAFFSDGTSMLLYPDGRTLDWISYEGQPIRIVGRRYSIDNCPEQLKPKAAALLRFEEHMKKLMMTPAMSSPSDKPAVPKDAQLPFVRKYWFTEHAIIFRLLNTIQINFLDHTKLILSSTNDSVTIITTDGQTRSLTLRVPAGQRLPEEVVARLSYARDFFQAIGAAKN